jgi:hypothetical protein
MDKTKYSWTDDTIRNTLSPNPWTAQGISELHTRYTTLGLRAKIKIHATTKELNPSPPIFVSFMGKIHPNNVQKCHFIQQINNATSAL